MPRPPPPDGTVTFLFTDIQGSTRLLHELGEIAYADALAEHRRLLRDAFSRHGGVEVDTQGDAFFIAFPSAEGALAGAAEGHARLALGPIRVRIGVGATEAAREAMGNEPDEDELKIRAFALERFDRAAFESAWERGRGLDLDAAFELATAVQDATHPDPGEA